MMDWVVDEVPPEGLDGEVRSVAAAACALPLAGGNVVEVRCDHFGCRDQLTSHHNGVLLAIAVLYCRSVLIPVRELRPVLGKHQSEPLLIQPQHITDMAAILQS